MSNQSVCEGTDCFSFFATVVIAVVLRNLSKAPAMIHVDTQTSVASWLDHLIVDIVTWVLDAWVEVESGETDLRSVFVESFRRISALEFDDPVILTAIFAFLEVDNCIGIDFIPKEYSPPDWRINEEASEWSWSISRIEVVWNDVLLAKAMNCECILDLGLANSSKLLLRANAA